MNGCGIAPGEYARQNHILALQDGGFSAPPHIAVANDADYQNLVIGNPDQQAVEAAMAMIIDRIIRQKRKGDMSLYREYQQNDAFKAGFRTLITRMIETA